MSADAKTPGQLAYESELQARPTYADGSARPAWAQLGDIVRQSWERNPTPRWSVETQQVQQ